MLNTYVMRGAGGNPSCNYRGKHISVQQGQMSSRWWGLTIGGRVSRWAGRGRYAAVRSLMDCLGIWLRRDAQPPLLIHPLRNAPSISPDSLEAGSKWQLWRILTTFSTSFLPFYQDNNTQFQYVNIICRHAEGNLSWSSSAAFIT